MSKADITRRHAAIKSVIVSKEISNQTQLSAALKSKGFEVTQATLSRDLAELGIVRVPTDEGYRYEIKMSTPEPVLRGFTAEEIISVTHNETLVVIRTFPGRAQGVAFMLDSKKDPHILGTIAGDDTILVVPKSKKTIKRTINIISHYLGLK